MRSGVKPLASAAAGGEVRYITAGDRERDPDILCVCVFCKASCKASLISAAYDKDDPLLCHKCFLPDLVDVADDVADSAEIVFGDDVRDKRLIYVDRGGIEMRIYLWAYGEDVTLMLSCPCDTSPGRVLQRYVSTRFRSTDKAAGMITNLYVVLSVPESDIRHMSDVSRVRRHAESDILRLTTTLCIELSLKRSEMPIYSESTLECYICCSRFGIDEVILPRRTDDRLICPQCYTCCMLPFAGSYSGMTRMIRDEICLSEVAWDDCLISYSYDGDSVKVTPVVPQDNYDDRETMPKVTQAIVSSLESLYYPGDREAFDKVRARVGESGTSTWRVSHRNLQLVSRS